jgi:spore germination cell wall hydrolase CwlJ-like protein
MAPIVAGQGPSAAVASSWFFHAETVFDISWATVVVRFFTDPEGYWMSRNGSDTVRRIASTGEEGNNGQ